MISSEDNGGVINFTYNAAGQQLKAIYGANTVTTTYDIWGRKSSFYDPSNGIYSYLYDGLGNLKKETSPKGYKQYKYYPTGLLEEVIEKSDDGTSTDKNYTFTYTPYGQITQKSGISNGKTYTTQYAYRPEGRLGRTTEFLEGRKFFKRDIQYDLFGRIKRYDQGLESNGVTTAVAIENNYAAWNGALYKVKQENTGKVLWELQETNARGQVRHAKLGEQNITNTYNTIGLVTNVLHASATVPAINNDYVFNAQKNELNSRFSHTLGINENFYYDEDNLPLNRLTSWTDPNTGNLHRSDYDAKGRITKNYQLGQMSYNTSGSVYRPASLRLNTEGIANYDLNGNSKLLQQITYNENNDPLTIIGTQAAYRFEYGLSESRQVMHYTGTFSHLARPIAEQYTKIYSESGDAEIIVNDNTGFEKHILYIGGTPYDSNIVYLKSSGESNGSFKFLHKDYLGNILAISDEAGNVVERRHYDAWGRVTHIKDGDGNDLSQFGIIDRGYTSHEHLAGVALIHMNGRLYDPLLRRFLNADENIQDPENTQIYNKYGYVMNNPLMGWDRDGEDPITIGTAILIAAIIGGTSYTLAILVNTGSLRQWSIFDFGKAVVIGGISGAATFGIGELFKTGGLLASMTSETAQLFTQAGLHGVSQGFMGMLDGGNFFQGFVAGALGSLGAKGWIGMVGENVANNGGMIAFGALSGGIGAELSGGNFFKGFMQGGIVSGLNHAMHSIESDLSDDGPRKPIRSRRVRSTDEAHSLKGSRDGATAVIPKIGDGPKAGQGPGIFVPSGSQSMVTADMTYYDDGTVDVNMTTQVERMNTTGSYIAGYDIVGPNGNLIERKFLAIPKYNRMDYQTYTTQGRASVLSTATFRNLPLNSTIRVNIGLTYKIPMGATGAMQTNHVIRVR